MNPNSAQISVVMNSAIGRATHGGRLNLRPAHSARLFSHVMRALPVQIADPQQPERDDQRDDRHADHLVERGAAAFASLRNELHCHPTLSRANQPT